MFQLNHNNLHLNYFGGSGGFLALHLLLLSNHYSNELNTQLDTVFQRQWDIADHSNWKHHEIWPDNNKTSSMPGLPKLFFYCNQSTVDWEKLYGTKLLVYTDLASQLVLSQYKSAWLYQKNVPAKSRDLNSHFEKFYNNIRALSWPDCTRVSDSKNLPEQVQQELLTHTEYLDFINAKSWDHWFVSTHQANKINNVVVYSEVAAVAKHSDLTIKLQDILNTNGQALLSPLGLLLLDQHVELVKKWKALHSNEILSIICRN